MFQKPKHRHVNRKRKAMGGMRHTPWDPKTNTTRFTWRELQGIPTPQKDLVIRASLEKQGATSPFKSAGGLRAAERRLCTTGSRRSGQGFPQWPAHVAGWQFEVQPWPAQIIRKQAHGTHTPFICSSSQLQTCERAWRKEFRNK